MIKLKEKNVYKIFEDFFNATKIHCCIFDENYSALCYYREDRRTYCDIMKSKPITCAFCDKCDTNAFTICNNTKTSHFYTCHSNLFEGIIPILHQNNIVAYIIMGQMRKNENIPPHLAKYAQTYNLNYDELLASYKSIPICDQKTFTSAMNLIEILISGTQFREFTEYLESNIVENIKYYILLHYTDDINVDTLCKQFFLSKAKIYDIFRKNGLPPVTKFIQNERLYMAMEMLKNSKKTIAEIASTVGIPDYNYLSKLIQKKTGMSPTKYRKSENIAKLTE